MVTQISSLEQFDEFIRDNEVAIVDFYADWCGPCKMLSPVIEEVAEENESISVCKVNVDQNPGLAAKFSVQGIPTVISFKNGEINKKSVGLVPKDTILSLV